jgi:hypothetical protein
MQQQMSFLHFDTQNNILLINNSATIIECSKYISNATAGDHDTYAKIMKRWIYLNYVA